MAKKMLLGTLGLLCLVVLGVWANWVLATPSHDRDWHPLYARLPSVSEENGTYRIENIRNWSYGPQTTEREEWISAQIDPGQLVAVFFLLEPFGTVEAVAHTMLSFEFADGSAYVASVEARREEGEVYGGLRAGLVPMHEYMIVWATERDMFANTVLYAQDDLAMLRLELSKEHARAVLEAMLIETMDLASAPRWYNTLFSNCTNVLARAINRQTDNALPWDISWYLPGYSIGFLQKQGLLAEEGAAPDVQAGALVNALVPGALEEVDPAAFSQRLRRMLSAR